MGVDHNRPDRRCILQFAGFLNSIGHPICGVDAWPEDTTIGDIDAILGTFAVQHTSIDTLPDGRERDVWFRQVVGGLEDQFRDCLGFRLVVETDWTAIQKRQVWSEVRKSLVNWIESEAAHLPDGTHVIDACNGVPFEFTATKGGPIRTNGVFFCRRAPNDRSLGARLKDLLVGRHDKLGVLYPYRAKGKKTLLLLESDDVALMNDQKMCDAFVEAFVSWPSGLDELWFAHRVALPKLNVHDLRRGKTWIYDPISQHIVSHNDDTYCLKHSGMLGLDDNM